MAGTRDPANECRACDPDLSQTAFTPIWSASCGADFPTEFELPGGGDVSQLASGFDVDGDGFGDIVFADSWGPEYYGGPYGRIWALSGRDSSVLREWRATGEERGLGRALALGPSFDGDGLADVAASMWIGDTSSDVVVLSSLQDAPIARIHGTLGCAELGQTLSLGGDVDGDGRSDLLVSARHRDEPCPDSPAALLYSSDAVLLRTWAAIDGSTGAKIVSIGPDVDGDGRSDILLSDPDADDLAGYVDVYAGAAVRRVHHWAGAAAGLGPDANGDGAADILMSNLVSLSPIRVHVVLRSGADGRVIWERLTSMGGALGPDANGDGRGDVVVVTRPDLYAAEPYPDDRVVEILDGGTGDLIKRLLPPSSASFRRLSYAGDIDGDGRADVVVVGSVGTREVLYVFGSAR